MRSVTLTPHYRYAFFIEKPGRQRYVLKQTTMTIYDAIKCERRLGAAFNNKLMICTNDATSDTCAVGGG